MSDSGRLEPPHGRAKLTPARELTGEAPSPRADSDVAEARVEIEGTRWTVRIVGRSGRASGASPSLLLLGFWEGEPNEDQPSLEAMVVGRNLEDLSTRALESALATAITRRDPERRVAFFPDTGQGPRR